MLSTLPRPPSLPSARLQTLFFTLKAFLGILNNAAAIPPRVICVFIPSVCARTSVCKSHISRISPPHPTPPPCVHARYLMCAANLCSCALSGETEEQTHAGFGLRRNIITAVAKAQTLGAVGRLGSKQRFFFSSFFSSLSLKNAFHVLNC